VTFAVHVFFEPQGDRTSEATITAESIEDTCGWVREAMAGDGWRAITVVRGEDLAKLMEVADKVD
jgi:hypothetical protein